MTIEEIKQHIENVIDTSRGKTLKELNAIKHVGINTEKDSVVLIIEVGKLKSQAEDQLKRELAKIIKLDLGFSGIKIQFEENKAIANISNKETNFILISSGKGGVGKSSVTINLAYALTRLGKKVGIIDADIYCASIARMLYVEDQTVVVDSTNKIVPAVKDNIEFISTDFFSEKEAPLTWRGAMLASMINNFLYQVAWSKDLNYILIDCPNGTGDIMLDLGNFLPNAKVLLVSEEDIASAYQVIKMGKAHRLMKQDILGVVINKYTGNEFADIFLSNKLETEVLAKIPYIPHYDNQYVFKESTEAYECYNDLAILLNAQD